ncbi:nuclear protein MDM1 [Limanda limanda]|uniref:nuclear protein MDM1 n=1 Tax=Limanda limanda TaxID=27771 RepID=UPI0029C84144|nr:nuclear protein MDM1 [Limanda limanda]
MTVRFKCRSEYQKSYRVSRSRSVSPQRCAPLAGLRSDQMRICRDPGLQRRKRPDPGGLTQSWTSLPCASGLQRPLAAPTAHTHSKISSSASLSRSAHRKDPSPKPPTPREAPAGPEPPIHYRPTPAPLKYSVSSAKLHPSQLHSQSQASHPLSAAPDGRQLSANEVEQALHSRAGLRSAGQRSPPPSMQMLYSSSRSIPPFKRNPVSMETEYQQNFQGVAPPTGPPLLKHLEHQRIPLFHTYTSNKKRREESQKMLRPKHNDPTSQEDDIRTPPPQVQRGHRTLTEYESSFHSPLYRIPEEGGAMDGDTPQVTELRQRAASYRSRAWGANFCRDHLNQLQSEHNALWEPTDSSTDPPTPRLTFELGQEPDSRSTSCVEALDLDSRSCSHRSSVLGSMLINTDEGRLTTPRLKMRPVQRTHHDLTTPATGGAILVGTVKSSDESSLNKQQVNVEHVTRDCFGSQGCGSVVSMAAALDMQIRQMEAWSEKSRPHRPSPGPSPDHKTASKPIRTKQTPPPTVAPPLQLPSALHCIQGTLRHPDFQHNGELGSRFMELQSSGDDEDDRLSVMSWRSAASCSAASAVLERAQKRRESFWGKR